MPQCLGAGDITFYPCLWVDPTFGFHSVTYVPFIQIIWYVYSKSLNWEYKTHFDIGLQDPLWFWTCNTFSVLDLYPLINWEMTNLWFSSSDFSFPWTSIFWNFIQCFHSQYTSTFTGLPRYILYINFRTYLGLMIKRMQLVPWLHD